MLKIKIIHPSVAHLFGPVILLQRVVVLANLLVEEVAVQQAAPPVAEVEDHLEVAAEKDLGAVMVQVMIQMIQENVFLKMRK